VRVRKTAARTIARMSGKRPMRVLTWEEWTEMSRDLPPPTDDDVSITNDGRRLDTAEKVIEFFAELEAERSAAADPDDERG
jgi:hypothetical protein